MLKKEFYKLPYFAYGSNLNLVQMKERCRDSKPIIGCTLKDAKLEFLGNFKDCGVANIAKAKNSEVDGALYWVTEDDIKILDVYEGFPRLYIKKKVKVITFDNKEVIAFAYVMNTGYCTQLPTAGYYNVIQKGYYDWGLSNEPLKAALSDAIEKVYKYEKSEI